MRKITAWMLVVVGLVSPVFLQACATLGTPFAGEDLTSIRTLKVVRYETPKAKVRNPGVGLAGTIIGTILGAVILDTMEEETGRTISNERLGMSMIVSFGLAVGQLAERGLGLGRGASVIPDFGELVMMKFVERASEEIPNCPAMTVEEQPMKHYTYYESDALLEFKVTRIALFGILTNGLACEVVVKMKCSESGRVVWQRKFIYKSTAFGRERSRNEYKADNFKLLKEEVEFAAEATVSDFIEHFKRRLM